MDAAARIQVALLAGMVAYDALDFTRNDPLIYKLLLERFDKDLAMFRDALKKVQETKR